MILLKPCPPAVRSRAGIIRDADRRRHPACRTDETAPRGSPSKIFDQIVAFQLDLISAAYISVSTARGATGADIEMGAAYSQARPDAGQQTGLSPLRQKPPLLPSFFVPLLQGRYATRRIRHYSARPVAPPQRPH